MGLDDKIISSIDESRLTSFRLVRVIQVNKNNCIVHNGTDEILAELTGKFLYTADSSLDLPAVGDWVYVQLFNDNQLAVIHDIVPRKSLIKRKTAGKKIDYQLIAANIDTAVIIQGLDQNYNIRRLERYIVMANEEGITPLVLLSKSDLADPDVTAQRKAELEKMFPGIRIIPFTNFSEESMQPMKEIFIPGRTYCLIGSSGVGKSTLINKLLGEENIRTQPIREKDGRGRHTTTRRELVFLDNGAMIIDNPGMRELGMMGNESGLNNTFDGFIELTMNCRYQDCTHTVEKGCAVLEAVENGTYPKESYEAYMKLYKEMKYNEMSYVEKRQKDKQFGKMINKALKIKKDKS